MSLGLNLMSLMSLGVVVLVCLLTSGVRLMSLGGAFDEFGPNSLGVRLEQGLGDEFGVEFDEFDEFGGHFRVCLRERGCVW